MRLTTPALTPAFWSFSMTSCALNPEVHAPTWRSSSSSLALRDSCEANFLPADQDGLPITRHSAFHSDSELTLIAHQRSSPWQGYAPCGAACGSRLALRAATLPL